LHESISLQNFIFFLLGSLLFRNLPSNFATVFRSSVINNKNDRILNIVTRPPLVPRIHRSMSSSIPLRLCILTWPIVSLINLAFLRNDSKMYAFFKSSQEYFVVTVKYLKNTIKKYQYNINISLQWFLFFNKDTQ
jgi:hypothetical protein